MAIEFSIENVIVMVSSVTLGVVYLETRMNKIATTGKNELSKVSIGLAERFGKIETGISDRFGKIETDIAIKIGEIKTAISDVKHDVSELNHMFESHSEKEEEKIDTVVDEVRKLGAIVQKHDSAIRGLQSVLPPKPRRVIARPDLMEMTPAIPEEDIK